jgi:hypothetical protein
MDMLEVIALITLCIALFTLCIACIKLGMDIKNDQKK